MIKTFFTIFVLVSILSISGNAWSGGHFITPEPDPLPTSLDNYSVTVKYPEIGNHNTVEVLRTYSMSSCQLHANAAVGVGAIILTPCHFAP